ncbi:MAG TPA: mitofilin family membrane protein [Alphaproteobacteria bacterium]
MGDEAKQAEAGPDESARAPNGGGETPPALRVIGAFGGIRPMAGKLDVPVSTVQGWKERGVIPESRHDEIRAAATAHGVTLDDADLAASADGPPAEAGAAAATETAAAPAEPRAAAAAEAEDGSAVTDEAPAPPHAAAARRGNRQAWISGFALGALVFSLGAGGAVLTRSVWAPADEGSAEGALAQQLAALEGRLAEIEARPAAPGLDKLATADDVARLEGQLTAMSAAAGATADLAAELKDLEARLTAMGASASAGAEAASALGGLSSRVAAVEAAGQEMRAAIDGLKARDAGKDALLWSAVSALRDALRYTGPFADQLADVRRLAGDRAEFREPLAALEPLAEGGVASLAELQRAFPATARDIVAAGYGASEEGVLGDVLSRVSQVVTVRPVGEVEGDSAGAIVARAEGQLGRGDLAAALKELEALPEAAKAAAAAWRARSEQRVAADAAISKLNALLAEQLAAGG